ncbi:hypothetical protein RJT34_08346 [Clitoria ternatea]|uniref:Uncharacterized protein n=1 Tax=Clitoria ternatea TaxID=43366 RepID=A0AAN9PU17_CLITE
MSPRVVGVGKYLGVLLDLDWRTYEIWVRKQYNKVKASWTKYVISFPDYISNCYGFSPLSFTQEGGFTGIITTLQRLVKLNPKGHELVDLQYHNHPARFLQSTMYRESLLKLPSGSKAGAIAEQRKLWQNLLEFKPQFLILAMCSPA